MLNLVGCHQESERQQQIPSTETTENKQETVILPIEIRREYATRIEIGQWPNLSGPFFNSCSPAEELTEQPDPQKRLLWSQTIGAGYSLPLVGQQELYLFHRQGDEELIDCRQLQNGELIWQFGFPTAYECAVEYSNGPYSTPALDKNHVYALGTEAKLYCLSRETGELVWIRDLQLDYEPEQGDFPVGSSPLVMGERVYLNLGGTKNESTVVAINKQTGETIWTALKDGRSYASPRYALLNDQPVLLIFSDKYLSGLNLDNGKLLWQTEFGVKKSPNRVNAVSPIVIDQQVYAAAGPGAGSICLDFTSSSQPAEKWRVPRNLDSQFNNIIAINDSLFGFTSKWNRQAQFRCLDRMTGEIRWEWPAEMGRGSIVAADGKFYLWGEEGELAVLKVSEDKPEVLFRAEEPLLKGPTYSAPVIAGQILLLRNEGTLLAIDLKK